MGRRIGRHTPGWQHAKNQHVSSCSKRKNVNARLPIASTAASRGSLIHQRHSKRKFNEDIPLQTQSHRNANLYMETSVSAVDFSEKTTTQLTDCPHHHEILP